MSADDYGGPCLCGGCRRCLHDQGANCGDPCCSRCVELREEAEDYLRSAIENDTHSSDIDPGGEYR